RDVAAASAGSRCRHRHRCRPLGLCLHRQSPLPRVELAPAALRHRVRTDRLRADVRRAAGDHSCLTARFSRFSSAARRGPRGSASVVVWSASKALPESGLTVAVAEGGRIWRGWTLTSISLHSSPPFDNSSHSRRLIWRILTATAPYSVWMT